MTHSIEGGLSIYRFPADFWPRGGLTYDQMMFPRRALDAALYRIVQLGRVLGSEFKPSAIKRTKLQSEPSAYIGEDMVLINPHTFDDNNKRL